MKHTKNTPLLEYLSQTVAVTLITVGSLILLGLTLAWILPSDPGVVPAEVLEQLAVHRANLRPEPTERAIFLASVLSTPFLLLIWGLYFKKRRSELNLKFIRAGIELLPIYLLIVLLCEAFAIRVFIPIRNAVPHSPFWVGVAVLFSGVTFTLNWKLPLKQKIPSGWITCFLLVWSGFYSLAWRVFSVDSITYLSTFTDHFEAAFYSAVQAVHHKLPLIDYVPQYGWYGVFVAPWLRWIGFSVHSFSWTMTGIQWLSFLAVFFSSSRWIKNRWVQFCLFSILLNAVGNWTPIGAHWDPYFQYFPIRFFCPALGLFLFGFWLRSRPLWLSLLISAFCGLSLLWNMDSGVAVVGAWITFLIYDWASGYFLDRPRFKKLVFSGPWSQRNWIHLSTSLLVPPLTCLLFVHLLFGSQPSVDWSALTRYQNLFFGAGFNMMPMPVSPHSWQSVCIMYVVALGAGIVGVLNQRKTQTLDYLFFTAVLGIGLFTYYQGRSHHLNLTAVAWPALIILSIFSDRVLTLFRSPQKWGAVFKKRAPLVLLVPIHLMGGVAWVSQFRGIPVIWDYFIQHEITEPKQALQNPLSIGAVAKTIKSKYFDPENRTEGVFLIRLLGTFLAETGLHTAIRGPGLAETSLHRDWISLLDQIEALAPPHLFVDETMVQNSFLELDPRHRERFRQILTHYQKVEKIGEIQVFARRKPSET